MNKKVVTKGTFQRQLVELKKKIKGTIQVDWFIIISHAVWLINSLTLGDMVVILKCNLLWIKFMSTCGMAPRWMPQNNFYDKSTLV